MDSLVCSQSRFTLKPYSRRKFVSSAKQFLPPRFFFSAVRRGIFVEPETIKSKAPLGAAYLNISLLTELGISLGAFLQICRA
jgi:hypothetical protein